MIGILLSLLIGILLGYIGTSIEYQGLVWIIFILMTLLIIVNVKKFDISAFLAIIFGGVGLLATQWFAPDAFTFLVDNIERYTSLVFDLFKDAKEG